MSRKNIRIEKLRIVLPAGTSAADARRTAAGIGAELARALGERETTADGARGARRIGAVEAGRVAGPAGTDELTRRIAGRIADALGEKGES